MKTKLHPLTNRVLYVGQETSLRWADLQEADLRRADLQGADLRWADLRWADLRGADLKGADLRGANLRRANLRWADLREADLDFSCWPLWCGSFWVKIDANQYRQLLYHIASVDCEEMKKHQETLFVEANKAEIIEKHNLDVLK